MNESTIKNNFSEISQNVADLAEKVGRDRNAVQLVAISKRQPMERIQDAVKSGHRLFGENRVQEAIEHWAELKTQYSDIKLHLVGSLQTNKAKEAVELFDVIETLDRAKLAKALQKEMDKQDRHLPCFIQVNTGDEPQKGGIGTQELPELLSFCKEECGLNIQGLMCIPPANEPAAMHFALLAKLAKEHGLKELSMGMSSDFEKAIPLGATYVRVGTALFGVREAIF